MFARSLPPAPLTARTECQHRTTLPQAIRYRTERHGLYRGSGDEGLVVAWRSHRLEALAALWSGPSAMTTRRPTTHVHHRDRSLERYHPVLSDVERMDIARVPRRLPRRHPRRLSPWICVSSPPGAGSTIITCSTCAAVEIENRSLATLEDRGKARGLTVARRLCTIVGFYRYAEEEGSSSSTPRPCTSADPGSRYESHVAHLDRNEILGAHPCRRRPVITRVTTPSHHGWRGPSTSAEPSIGAGPA